MVVVVAVVVETEGTVGAPLATAARASWTLTPPALEFPAPGPMPSAAALQPQLVGGAGAGAAVAAGRTLVCSLTWHANTRL